MLCRKKYKASSRLCSIGWDNILVSGQVVENVATKLLQLAVTELPQDVKDALKKAYNQEEDPVGKSQLKAILDNVQLAEKTCTPMCQDTGVIIFYIKAGLNF